MYILGTNSSEPGVESIAGLVPNGVNTVSLDLANGGSQQLAVHENVYIGKVDGQITTIHFTTPSSGAVTLRGVSEVSGSGPTPAANAASSAHASGGLVTLRGR